MKTKRDKVIYTCITGGYDELTDHQYVHPDWDYVCFSDVVKTADHNKSWHILPLKNRAADDQRTNRWHKINAHLCMDNNYRYSVYIDANIDVLNKSFFEEIDKQIGHSSIFSIMTHPERDCIYDEIKACSLAKKDNVAVMEQQAGLFKSEGYPQHNGLYTSSILYRQHNDKKVVDIMTDWWGWVRDHSRRDQLSLPYVLWKHNYVPSELPFTYGLGKLGPLFFYPHAGGVKPYTRELYEQVAVLEAENEGLTKRLQEAENKIRLIEKSRIWRLRNLIVQRIKNK